MLLYCNLKTSLNRFFFVVVSERHFSHEENQLSGAGGGYAYTTSCLVKGKKKKYYNGDLNTGLVWYLISGSALEIEFCPKSVQNFNFFKLSK